MKRIYIYKLLFFVFVVILVSSCKKSFFFDKINDDPTQITKEQLVPSVLLNGAEVSIGYTIGGDVSRYTSVLTQQVQGAVRQFASYQKYIFASQDFDNAWSNVYTQGINNLLVLKNLSDKKGYNHYGAISRVLLAYYYGLATDLWGDIPRTQSGKGDEGLLNPVYDKQQDVYAYIQTTLDSAITLLSGTGGGVLPGEDDFIYKGNKTKWSLLAKGLKARYYLHLSKRDPAYADKVLGLIASSLTNSGDNAVVPFFANETQANPWYQYIRDRGDISYVGGFFNTELLSLNDPRADVFIDQANDVILDKIAGWNAPVTLFSYAELLFIKAEALSAKNDPSTEDAYKKAIEAAFDDAGVSMPSDYLTVNALTGSTHASRLPQIMLQKYFALFTQPEVFNDWRRTGFPALTPNTGNAIPRRFLYPQSELSYNKSNIPSGTTLFTKVWWDN